MTFGKILRDKIKDDKLKFPISTISKRLNTSIANVSATLIRLDSSNDNLKQLKKYADALGYEVEVAIKLLKK